MVQAGKDRVNILVGVPQVGRERRLRMHGAVAETDGIDARVLGDAANVGGQRVRVIDHPGVRSEVRDILGNPHQLGNMTQAAQHATGSDAVTDRLRDPIFLRDLDVTKPARRRPHRDGRGHEPGIRERLPAIGVRLQPDAGAVVFRRPATDLRHDLGGLAVDVDETDGEVVEGGIAGKVAQQSRGEDRTSGPDENERVGGHWCGPFT